MQVEKPPQTTPGQERMPSRGGPDIHLKHPTVREDRKKVREEYCGDFNRLVVGVLYSDRPTCRPLFFTLSSSSADPEGPVNIISRFLSPTVFWSTKAKKRRMTPVDEKKLGQDSQSPDSPETNDCANRALCADNERSL